MSSVDTKINERKFWNEATKSDNLRNEWICDKNVSDGQCWAAVKPYLKEGKTLDLGCGIGRLTVGFGVDISPEMLKLARPGPVYKLTDGRTIPFKDDYFDNVFSTFMFQHIPNRGKLDYIKEVYRVLKDGGRFRLQYVNSGDKGEFSYPCSDLLIDKFLKAVGFQPLATQNLIYPQWTWVTAVK